MARKERGKTKEPSVLDVVALLADRSPEHLARGQVGTVVELLDDRTALVEFTDDQGRAYLPQTTDILAATRLLEPGQKETLKLTAPSQEGEHEYVCTFPGHHQVMWGWLIVTKDVEAYLRAHPEVALSAPSPAGG